MPKTPTLTEFITMPQCDSCAVLMPYMHWEGNLPKGDTIIYCDECREILHDAGAVGDAERWLPPPPKPLERNRFVYESSKGKSPEQVYCFGCSDPVVGEVFTVQPPRRVAIETMPEWGIPIVKGLGLERSDRDADFLVFCEGCFVVLELSDYWPAHWAAAAGIKRYTENGLKSELAASPWTPVYAHPGLFDEPLGRRTAEVEWAPTGRLTQQCATDGCKRHVLANGNEVHCKKCRRKSAKRNRTAKQEA